MSANKFNQCKVPGCFATIPHGFMYCDEHLSHSGKVLLNDIVTVQTRRRTDVRMSETYPKYYKAVPAGVTELDVYSVCQLFPVDDPSGAINHARKKLLVPGVRTGGKSLVDDVREARDTLNRWLELNAKPEK